MPNHRVNPERETAAVNILSFLSQSPRLSSLSFFPPGYAAR